MIIEEYNKIEDIPALYVVELKKCSANLFGKLEWFNLLQKHIISSNEQVIYFCILNMQKKIEALFPFVRIMNKPQSNYHYKSLANFYTMQFEPLIIRKPRNARKVITAFTNHMAEKKNWDFLEIFPQDREKLSNILLEEDLSEKFHINSTICHKNWIYRNNKESFDSYVSYSTSRVKDIRREERRILKKYDLRFEICTHKSDLERFIKDYQVVYDNSWKEKEQFPDFIPEMIRLCADLDILRLGIFYIDNTPTASQFNIFHDNETLIYKLSYQEQYKKLSVGSILSFKMMQYAFDEDRSTIIDYGCGNDSYKKNWMNSCRDRHILTIYNNNLSGKKLYLKQRWKNRIKHLLNPENYREI